MKLHFDDTDFDGQLQRSVGKCDSGMANVGECLAIAGQITPGDRDSWYEAWSGFAGRLVAQADTALAAGHHISARDSYLRAAEYHRQAFFYHREDLDGPELRSAYLASVAAFHAALPLLDFPGEVLSGGATGYLFTPNGAAPDGGRWPTILHIGGYDGTAEELYASVAPALVRGYAFAAIDGPGQGSVLYDQRIPMRPDWENVIGGIVDALITHPEIDPDRVVLVGRSFGGALAPRAAAGERRLAAMIVDPGQYDMGATVSARLGDLMAKVHDPDATAEFESLLTIPALWNLFKPRMTTHGVTTVREYLESMLLYTNVDTAASITCPSYVTDNETDLVSTGQGKLLFDALTCPKEFRLFTQAEGAEGHCEGMAPVVFWAAAYDWLDALLASH
jgi:pimeloyl-ACP methyl ester carboxylesterase